MSISKIALAIPLALGMACSHSGTQARDHAAAWQPSDPAPESASSAADVGGTQEALSVQPTAGSSDSSASGSSGSQGSMGSTGSSGSSDSGGSSSSGATSGGGGPSGDTGASGGSGQPGAGGQMGAGGSSETMGAGNAQGGSDQGGTGDTGASGSQSAAAGGGTTGAHAGDQKVMGKVTKISKDEIAIQPKGGEAKTLKLNEDTSVMVNGKDAKWSQLKKGQSVRATYENVGGDDVAVRVESGGARQARSKRTGGTGAAGGAGTTH